MATRKRILIINVNWVGDVLFTTPFIRAVRQAHPESYIACLVHPRCREMLDGNPRLDEIIAYDEEGAHRSALGKLRLVAALRKRRFDTAFILHRSFTKAAMAFLAGAKERIGYPTKRRAVFLTTAVEEPDEETHKVEYFLAVAAGAGIRPAGRSYEFFIKDSDRRHITGLLEENGIGEGERLIVLCPGGNWDPKRWPRENFAQAADMLAEEFGARIAIAGGRKDVKLAEDISALMKTKPLIACGKTTLKELGALLERADLVIANDTGPMHIAVAMGSNVLALFGPTSPYITGPYGDGSYRVISRFDGCAIPCYHVACNDNRCMRAITVQDVMREAEKLLKVKQIQNPNNTNTTK